jgi:hypothetical protein
LQCEQRRLTLPSRGCPKGCAFCAPLMSNVRRLYPGFSEAPVNENTRLANQVSRMLRSPLLGLEPDHTLNTTHALAEGDCQIGRLLRASAGRSEARCNRSARAVRPASLEASARLWWLESTECRRPSSSNSYTLRAGSKRGASMQARSRHLRAGAKQHFTYTHLAFTERNAARLPAAA